MKGRKSHKKSTGGEVPKSKTMYNAKGSPAAAAAMDTTDDGFKKGGVACKKGGKVHGAPAKARLDKRARGGSVKSTGNKMAQWENKASADGHAGNMPSDV